MRAIHRARLGAVALVLLSASAHADEVVLDLHAALERAKTSAPEAVAARGRIGEAEAARAGAEVRFSDNPELEASVGPRFGATTTTDLSVSLGQTFGLGGRRGARRAVAEAGAAQARAEGDAVARDVQLEAALAFLDGLHAQAAVDAAVDADELAWRAVEVAERRRKAGDITDLQLGLARAAAARSRVAVEAARRQQVEAIARLAPLVGLASDDTVVLRGELKPTEGLTLAALDTAAVARPDLRALEAEARVAAGEARRARAEARPDLGVFVEYGREEDVDLVRAGLRLVLPVWDRGQGPRAAARAHGARVTAEHAPGRRTVAREVRDAFVVYEHARRAADIFDRDVKPVLDDSEALLDRSVDAGTISVADYLLARQELAVGRREQLDVYLALARARVTALLTAGVEP
jgi:cobalt-zinc-cadmium efflux system outer membrane protein